MHHIENNVIDKSEYHEHKANKFADEVKFHINQMNQDIMKQDMKKRMKKTVLYTVPAFLLSAAAVTTIILCIKQIKSDDYKYYQKIQEITPVITEMVTESTTEVATETQPEPTTEVTEATTESTIETTTEEIAEENDETLYYVSTSGTKYHLKTCYQINPDRCIPLTLEQVESMGYSPCKTCRPNE